MRKNVYNRKITRRPKRISMTEVNLRWIDQWTEQWQTFHIYILSRQKQITIKSNRVILESGPTLLKGINLECHRKLRVYLKSFSIQHTPPRVIAMVLSYAKRGTLPSQVIAFNVPFKSDVYGYLCIKHTTPSFACVLLSDWKSPGIPYFYTLLIALDYTKDN